MFKGNTYIYISFPLSFFRGWKELFFPLFPKKIPSAILFSGGSDEGRMTSCFYVRHFIL